MRSRVLVPLAAGLLLAPPVTIAADLHARRMEIVQTPEGQVTVFRDSVEILDGSTRISAGRAMFNERLGIAVVSDSVSIEEPGVRVFADSAIYYLDGREAELFGSVRVELESLVVEAPHLHYHIRDRRVEASAGLTVYVPDRGLSVDGLRGRYFINRRIGEVDSLPVMRLKPDEASRSDGAVQATANTIVWSGWDQTVLLVGEARVSAASSKLTADSLWYWIGADSGVAWGEPRLADSLSSTLGDTISFVVEEGSLRRLAVVGSARGHYKAGASEIGVLGERIDIRLYRGELESVEVFAMTRGWLVNLGVD